MNEKPKIVGFGEVMLRLKTPGRERFLQSPGFEASFGGSEFNVLASLSLFSMDCSLVSAVPDNAIGAACLKEIRSLSIGCDQVTIGGDRLGLYYLEAGSGFRGSNIIYDRTGSAFAHLKAGDIDWDLVFQDCDVFHVSGITLALSSGLTQVLMEGVKAAKERNIAVSFDCNYRSKLWDANKFSAPEIYQDVIAAVDYLFASEHDCKNLLGLIPNDSVADAASRYHLITEQVFEQFPNLQMMACSFREDYSANHSILSAGMRTQKGFHISREFELTEVVDRIGSGDAFAAGVLYALLTGKNGDAAVEFAAAAAALKHTIPGDYNRITVFEVEALLDGNKGGRVNR